MLWQTYCYWWEYSVASDTARRLVAVPGVCIMMQWSVWLGSMHSIRPSFSLLYPWLLSSSNCVSVHCLSNAFLIIKKCCSCCSVNIKCLLNILIHLIHIIYIFKCTEWLSSGSRIKPLHFHTSAFLETVNENTPFKSLHSSEHNKQL